VLSHNKLFLSLRKNNMGILNAVDNCCLDEYQAVIAPFYEYETCTWHPAASKALMRSPDLPAELKTKIVRSLMPSRNHSTFCEDIARGCDSRDPGGSAEVLHALAEGRNELRRLVAAKPTAPDEMLEQLAKDPELGVRCNVASNRNALVELLEQLGKDVDPAVRRHVAAHPNASVEPLGRLAKDPDPIVRRFVARHVKTAADTLFALADNPIPDARRDVAANGSAPLDTLQKLPQDDDMKDAVTCNPFVQKALSFLLIDRLAKQVINIRDMDFR
jgi:hypothetical protein